MVARPGTGSAPSGEASPERRSVKERLADAQPNLADALPTGTGDNPLTKTALGISTFTTTEGAFTIDSTGVITRSGSASPIAVSFDVQGPAAAIDVERVRDKHVLVLSDEVDPAELEALAVSMWDDAGWVGPGELRLSSSATLRGAWSVDAAARRALGTPEALTQAWVLDCPRTRSEEVSESMGEWARAFPDGVPTGLEYRILQALARMARRLAGALRLAPSGFVMEPDAESAVNLTVYSPRWIAPEDLLSALRDRGGFTGLADARDLSPAGPSPQMEDAEAERIARLRQDLGPMREDIAARIERERQELAATGESQKVVEGYALVGPIGGRSEVMIEVHAVPSPPRVLRWEPWTASTIIEYQVRWLPGGSLDAPDATLSRSARRERLRSASDIENAAGLIATMAGGNVIDEDGFLVGLEEIQEADDQETQD